MQLKEVIDLNCNDNLKEIDITNIKLIKKDKIIKIHITVNDLILFSELDKIKNEMEEYFNGYFKVLFIIKYKGNQLDTEKFIKKYVNNIYYIIGCKYPMINKSSNSIDIVVEDKSIMIKTSNLLVYEKMKIDNITDIISKSIKEIYNINVCLKIDFINKDNICNNEQIIEEEIKKNLSNNKPKVQKQPQKVKENKSFYKSKLDKLPIMKIRDINDTVVSACIVGKAIEIDKKELRNGRTLLIFSITDLTDTIYIKYFCSKNEELEDLKKNNYYKVKGNVAYDNFMRQTVIIAKKFQKVEVKGRIDNAKEKRVELHLHTGMSSMDGTNTFKDFANLAKKWGHKALAITDHGVVQGFPDAMACSDEDLKVLYGMEGYLVDDGNKIAYNCDNKIMNDDIVVFDIETTGFNQKKDDIIEIGAVKIRNRKIIERFNTLIYIEKEIPRKITELTGITNDMLEGKPQITESLEKFMDFIGNNSILAAHNSNFDVRFIKEKLKRYLSMDRDFSVIDTLELSRALVKNTKNYKLNTLVKKFNIKLENHHRAVDDAEATAKLLLSLFELAEKRDIQNITELDSNLRSEIDIFKKPFYHILILVKNYTGLKNLYQLVSASHLKYFYKKPRILKSELAKYRDGLILGTACEAGQLYKAVLNGISEENIKKIVEFYDFLEVQPLANNKHLVKKGFLNSKDDLIEINKKIIDLGEQYNKLVVATGDTHFLNKEDELYRKILMSGQGYDDAEDQAPLYFMTTEEMLEKFNYLEDEKAYEIVVKNTNLIADSIENILPIPNGTFPPIIEGADNELREMTYNRARSIYGRELPKIVEDRLERELNSIISNGYAVMYIIAQKLVKKSLEDGYIVGSRGSVGSSFVATMSGITEVNPLEPHYICKKCKYSEFISDGSIGSGVDLEDKDCPKCGEKLIKEGHDIPFEVFLGFKGDKEPDIDLNFAGEEQSEAMKYTEVLFGEGKVFRAGTIGTIASKTAYGFVKNYYDEKGMIKRGAEINRVVEGCTGIKRTSGQHPGGVMVVPRNKDIHDFTPVQYPANNKKSGVITTHFDYHSISGRILKLDLLGHDTPSIIRMLEDFTGIDNSKVPLDDKETMKIFEGPEVLGVSSEDIRCLTGTLGIPEFGTAFVRQMLLDTKPRTFSDLVRISGLSHGTDVWINNAQELIRNNIVKIKDVISTRDDIMTYLIYNGLEKKRSFDIMERVRKGKGLNDDDIKAMNENDIPQWYIDSCNKIKYMFPKAHAVAYVMMSVKIAYFKVHYPEAFYATYFTMKAEDFDADIITRGENSIIETIDEIESKGNDKTAKEKNFLTVLEVALEMYKRGYKFTKVDLYKSDNKKFKLSEDGIIPPLISLQGVGQNVALNIKMEREKKEFISIEDIVKRAKASKTVIEVLEKHGCLKKLDKTNQVSIFNI